MFDIARAEWGRYRGWIAAYAIAHLLLLVFFGRIVDLGQQPLTVYRAFAAGYGLTGLLLGMHQMGTWRKPNAWLQLLHRPLAPSRIAMALVVTATAGLVVAVALPVALTLAWQLWGSARVVDPRHGLLPLSALSIAACGYLAGAYGMLADRRYAASGLVLLLWIGASQATGVGALGIQALACACGVGLVLAAFRPDLGSPPKTFATMLLVTVPVLFGAYVGILLLGFLSELAWIMLGSHPANMALPPAGGFTQAERMTPRDRLLAGLAPATLGDVPLWREQVALSDVHAIGRQVGELPWRGQISNPGGNGFDADPTRVHWTFRHATLRYAGRHVTDGTSAGTLGVGLDNMPFPAVASVAGEFPGGAAGDRAIVAANTLYRYVASVGRVVPRIALPGGEFVLGITPVGGSLVVLGDRALYVVDGRHLADGEGLVSPRQRVPLPGMPGDLSRIDLAELVDGYLVSLTFTAHASDPFGIAPFQTVLWVDDAGKVTPVATRSLGEDYPAAFRYRGWWPSPAMYALRKAGTQLFAHADPTQHADASPLPDTVRTLAASSMLASVFAAAWLARRRRLRPASALAWITACGVIGPPAVVGLMLIVPMPEHVPASVAAIA
ncbi:hypothetical protein P3W24_15320 [Luteibacter sp. PPL201]|uniref:ABC transporter permease n=1 Tax=Luteibacter sahnii TaxID=3021977 RepID=A0ABT6BE74_9GAMM